MIAKTPKLFLFLVLADFVQTVVGQNGHCNICRNASPLHYNVDNPDAIFATIGNMTMTCEEAQNHAFQLDGLPGFTTEQCADVQDLAAGVCGCPDDDADAVSTEIVSGRQEDDNPLVFCVLCLNSNDATINGFIGGLQVSF